MPTDDHRLRSMHRDEPAFAVEILDRAAAIRKLPRELDDLASRALEPNVFGEALMFIPALQHIDVHVRLWIVCIRNPAGALMGVIPLVREPLRHGLPMMVLRNWRHRYCYLGTPLLDAQAATQVLATLAAWIESGAAPAGGLQWVNISWDGPFGALLRATMCQAPAWIADVATARRAILERDGENSAPVSGKHAKELRRLERRLAAYGAVDYSAMQPGEDWQPWYEAFLAVEGSGWKGAQGSAIRSNADVTAFFSSVVREAHAAGRLQLMRLTVAGKAVAMKLNVRGCGVSYSIKIGHDEAYARFSPGVLLELFNIKTFEQEPASIRTMDSCAAENHPMINRLWSGRRELATVTLVRRGVLLRAVVKLRPLLRQYRQARLARDER